MSAFLNSADHIDLLVSGMIAHQVTGYTAALDNPTLTGNMHRVEDLTADATGRLLIDEQIASVSYRYHGEPLADLPGPNDKSRLVDYRYRPVYRGATPLDYIAAAQGYSYQACEHPGWRDSMAHALIESLTVACLYRLPGMEASSREFWSWDRPAGEPEPISLLDMAASVRASRATACGERR